jgi:hypothetical protein
MLQNQPDRSTRIRGVEEVPKYRRNARRPTNSRGLLKNRPQRVWKACETARESVYKYLNRPPGNGHYDKGAKMKLITELTARRVLGVARDLLVSRFGAILAALLLGCMAASAQEDSNYRGTSDQQSACMGDVFRLCGSEIPNVSRIVACLVREKPQLSAGCKAVFSQPATRTVSLRHRRLASAHHHHLLGYELQSER